MNLLRPLLLLSLLLLAACGGDAADPAAREPAAGESIAGEAPAGVTITLHPVDNEMRYAQTAFTVEAGQEVTIVFENTATSEAMHHNVVVLNSNDDADVNRVGQAALTAAESDYIPDDPAILAHTPMSAPGETVRVTFTAPSEPGTYRYICTYPGHYTLMQGTMTVT